MKNERKIEEAKKGKKVNEEWITLFNEKLETLNEKEQLIDFDEIMLK